MSLKTCKHWLHLVLLKILQDMRRMANGLLLWTQAEEELEMTERQQREHERALAAQLMSVHDRHLADLKAHEVMLQRKLQDQVAQIEKYKRRRRVKLW